MADAQTGIYTVPSGLALGHWQTQVAIDELDPSGAKVGQVVVDFIFEIVNTQKKHAPVFDRSITPFLG